MEIAKLRREARKGGGPIYEDPPNRARESFDNIYLNLSKEPGKCRLAESGLGWKPQGGQTFTLDKAELISAQWSRAAKAHELKIYARHAGVVQLDGFKQEVRFGSAAGCRNVLTSE